MKSLKDDENNKNIVALSKLYDYDFIGIFKINHKFECCRRCGVSIGGRPRRVVSHLYDRNECKVKRDASDVDICFISFVFYRIIASQIYFS